MLRATLKGVLAHKVRLGLSAVAVLLGVAFVAGTLIFTDTLGKAFRDLTSATAADVTVTQRTSFDTTFGPPGTTAVTSVPEEVRATVAGIEGVEAADGDVTLNGVQLVGKDGKVVGSAGGAPGVGTNWYASEGSPLSVEEGRPPERTGEIAVERGTAEKAGVGLGQSVRVLLPKGQPVDARVVGILDFEGNLLGATLVAFDTATAQELLLEPGRWTSVVVTAADGTDNTTLRDRVSAAVPGDYTAKTAEQIADEAEGGLADVLTFINVFLLVFAGIALFVGSFIILNTFSMLVAQRTRELALLRALGAGRTQVIRSVLLEAAVVGVVGSVLGLGAGVLLAYGLQALFGFFGLDLGDGSLLVDAGTVVTSLLLGTVVTVIAALGPAVRASRVAPVAAMRDDVGIAPKGLRVRGILGAVLTAAGAALLTAGLVADGSASGIGVGLGALLVLVGVAVLAPVLTRPVVGALAAAYPRLFGTVGRLGRDNAQRNPRRTAATASALMIGLALVGAIGTLAASTNASIERVVDRALGADFVVSTTNATPFSTDVTAGVRAVPGVETVSPARLGWARIGGDDQFPLGVDPATIEQVIAVEYVSGSTAALADDALLVDASTATDQGWRVGDAVPVTFPLGEKQLRVAGVYEDNVLLGPLVVSLPTLQAGTGVDQDNLVYVGAAEGADVATVKAGIESRLAAYPNVSLKDQTEYKDEQKNQVAQLTSIIYGLLALSVLIASLGIVNTLALSVLERTREIGLLRAVGMSRWQLQRMVWLESVVIALFGAVLGLGIGVGFGVALQRALADDGISELAMPVGQLVAFLVIAALIGVLAALWPAWRAARLDVLRAIATQ